MGYIITLIGAAVALMVALTGAAVLICRALGFEDEEDVDDD